MIVKRLKVKVDTAPMEQWSILSTNHDQYNGLSVDYLKLNDRALELKYCKVICSKYE